MPAFRPGRVVERVEGGFVGRAGVRDVLDEDEDRAIGGDHRPEVPPGVEVPPFGAARGVDRVEGGDTDDVDGAGVHDRPDGQPAGVERPAPALGSRRGVEGGEVPVGVSAVAGHHDDVRHAVGDRRTGDRAIPRGLDRQGPPVGARRGVERREVPSGPVAAAISGVDRALIDREPARRRQVRATPELRAARRVEGVEVRGAEIRGRGATRGVDHAAGDDRHGERRAGCETPALLAGRGVDGVERVRVDGAVADDVGETAGEHRRGHPRGIGREAPALSSGDGVERDEGRVLGVGHVLFRRPRT